MRKIVLKKPPTEKVKEMRNADLSDDDIMKALKTDFSNQEVNDAFNQESQGSDDNILDQLDQFEPAVEKEDKNEESLLEEAPAPEASEPSFNRYSHVNYSAAPELNSNQVQEVVEAVVEEKWEDFISKIGDINLWKENINNDIESIKQEVLRVQERFSNLQNILIGKVTDYNKNVTELNAEMKALEQVMQKIIEPLTSNVKELGKITSELKKKK